MVLGKLRYAAATPALVEAAMNTKDPYLQEAIAQALGAIGDRKALPCLERLRRKGLFESGPPPNSHSCVSPARPGRIRTEVPGNFFG
jgi:hypothetical protein